MKNIWNGNIQTKIVTAERPTDQTILCLVLVSGTGGNVACKRSFESEAESITSARGESKIDAKMSGRNTDASFYSKYRNRNCSYLLKLQAELNAIHCAS